MSDANKRFDAKLRGVGTIRAMSSPAKFRTELIRPGMTQTVVGRGQLPAIGEPFPPLDSSAVETSVETSVEISASKLADGPIGELCDLRVAGLLRDDPPGDEASSCG